MSITAPPVPVSAGASSRVERLFVLVGGTLVVSGVFHLLLLVIGGGTWEGPVSWRKPATFGLSFGITLWTTVWVTRQYQIGPRLRRPLLTVLAADSVLEVGGITLQAWRGVPSHVNRETAFDSAVSTALAAGGGVLILTLVSLAAPAFLRQHHGDLAMVLAVRAGFASLFVGLVTGALMIARGVTETNAGHQQQAYLDLGYLKAVHGVSIHGILVIPLVAWAVARRGWSRRNRVWAVTGAIAAYAGAMVVVTVTSVGR